MLLENIFAVAFCLFLLSLALIFVLRNFDAWWLRKFDGVIVGAYLASGFVTIVTAIWWIVRAWG